jgi:uncharacterized membrane protein
MNIEHGVMLAHAAASCYMAGLIWFVQIVHYPLFARVGDEQWTVYSSSHKRRTTVVVAPVMVLELTTVVLISLGYGSSQPWSLQANGIGLLALIWISTFAVQVPVHARLANGPSVRLVRWLVRTNWIRTICWSGRAVVALLMLS